MKKFMAVVMMMITVMCFTACGSNAKTNAFSSKYFTEDEYKAAVETVNEYFKGFEGATMEEIHYAGDDVVEQEAEYRGVDCKQVMVLYSTFTTDGENRFSGLEPNHTYENFNFILTRDSADGDWTVIDHGY